LIDRAEIDVLDADWVDRRRAWNWALLTKEEAARHSTKVSVVLACLKISSDAREFFWICREPDVSVNELRQAINLNRDLHDRVVN
jgi:hypothetical protein